MSKWESEKEELERLINIEKVSYEEIGRRYGCSGSNIKKVAKLIGIDLPQRRKVNPSETFNKGRTDIHPTKLDSKILYIWTEISFY